MQEDEDPARRRSSGGSRPSEAQQQVPRHGTSPGAAAAAAATASGGGATEIIFVDEAAEQPPSGVSEGEGTVDYDSSDSDASAEEDRRQARGVISGVFVGIADFRRSESRHGQRPAGAGSEPTNWALRSNSNATQVGQQLAKLAVDIDRKYGASTFDPLLDAMPAAFSEDTYGTFSSLLQGLLGTGAGDIGGELNCVLNGRTAL